MVLEHSRWEMGITKNKKAAIIIHYEKSEKPALLKLYIENLIKNDCFSSLLKTALEAEVEAKNLEVDKEFLEKKIIILKEKKDEKDKEKIACIQESLKAIQDKIRLLSQRAKAIGDVGKKTSF